MSNCIKFIFILITLNGFSQIETSTIEQIPLDVKSLVRVDNFSNYYYIDSRNAFHKFSPKEDINYSNVQLGTIGTANAFNNLKINLYYEDFNTVIILDNRLAEIFKINLNELIPYRNISHISTAYDNHLWMFNSDFQQLELYDYKAQKLKLSTLPVESRVLDLKSDYNYVWLLTERFLYQYNYQGSLVQKHPNLNYKSIMVEDENLLISDGKSIWYLDADSNSINTVKLPDLLIKQFLLAGETLYIYDGKILYRFQLKIK